VALPVVVVSRRLIAGAMVGVGTTAVEQHASRGEAVGPAGFVEQGGCEAGSVTHVLA
jgi:hypothetical protein